MRYLSDMYKILCDFANYLYKFLARVHNLTANSRLRYRTPYETITGETGDLSHLRYPFWLPIWYYPHESGGQGTMRKGRYLGPATSVGDEITHYVIPVVSGKLDEESIVKVDI